jgi:hypothetical protein
MCTASFLDLRPEAFVVSSVRALGRWVEVSTGLLRVPYGIRLSYLLEESETPTKTARFQIPLYHCTVPVFILCMTIHMTSRVRTR